VQDGIQAARSLIKRSVFDREKCREGIEALIQYQSEYNDKKQVFSKAPLHNWCSDYADSFRYYAVCPSSSGYIGEIDYSMANQL
jgi:phage terminase large subunit